MTTHVKVTGVLYIAFSAIYLCVALFMLFAFGAATAGVAASHDPDAAIAIPILGIAGTALITFLLLLGLPGLITGIGLLYMKPWARIAAIVLAAINLIQIPIGTLFGAYVLWVMLNKDTEQLFSRPALAA
jgi:hypothetical protein